MAQLRAPVAAWVGCWQVHPVASASQAAHCPAVCLTPCGHCCTCNPNTPPVTATATNTTLTTNTTRPQVDASSESEEVFAAVEPFMDAMEAAGEERGREEGSGVSEEAGGAEGLRGGRRRVGRVT